jgi:hypothetical protein
MTSREFYESILIELNKLGAPDMLIDEFNYYINKALYQYVNKRYSVYDADQQTTDDLQVLKSNTIITGANLRKTGRQYSTPKGANLQDARFELLLPSDYYHILNCVLTYTLQQDYRCYPKNYEIYMPAKRIRADKYASVLNNAWLKPNYKQPYYLINTNPLTIQGDWVNNNQYEEDKVKLAIQKKAGNTEAHNAWEDKDANGILTIADDYVGPIMEIDYGRDVSVFLLTSVNVNYLKVPEKVMLTPDQVDMTEDKSQVLQFPEYVCREIVKEAVSLIMLRTGDPALQASIAVNQSIPPVPPILQVGGQQAQS